MHCPLNVCFKTCIRENAFSMLNVWVKKTIDSCGNEGSQQFLLELECGRLFRYDEENFVHKTSLFFVFCWGFRTVVDIILLLSFFSHFAVSVYRLKSPMRSAAIEQ